MSRYSRPINCATVCTLNIQHIISLLCLSFNLNKSILLSADMSDIHAAGCVLNSVDPDQRQHYAASELGYSETCVRKPPLRLILVADVER